MPSDCCGKSVCSCILQAGTGITILGSGTASDPYTFDVNLPSFLIVQDTPTVNLTLTGSNTADDPLRLQADSSLKLTDLKDVADPGGGPAVGESPVWTGSGSAGHWEFKIPSTAPAGAVNVSNGVGGDGTIGTPIKVLNSGTWGSGSLAGLGSDSTIGLPVYIDSAGNVRAAPAAQFLVWANITGKPTYFPVDPSTTWPATNITSQSSLNAGKVNSIKVSSTANSVTPPSSPSNGDLWFFPVGT